jgi:hypothetical protein
MNTVRTCCLISEQLVVCTGSVEQQHAAVYTDMTQYTDTNSNAL